MANDPRSGFNSDPADRPPTSGSLPSGPASDLHAFLTGHPSNRASRQHDWQHIMLMLHERRWWIISFLFIGILGALMYCYNTAPIYRSTATVQVLRGQNVGTEFQKIVDMDVRNVEDFNTQVKILESFQLVSLVLGRMTPSEVTRLVSPYRPTLFESEVSPLAVLFRNRTVIPMRMTLLVGITFSHPDADLAARICNYFAEEFTTYNLRLRIEGTMKAVHELQQRAEEQRRKVEETETLLADFKERHRSVSFDQSSDIDQQQLAIISAELANRRILRDQALANWLKFDRVLNSGGDLLEIHMVREDPVVARMLSQHVDLTVQHSALAQKYRPRHPRMVESQGMLDSNLREIDRTARRIAESIHNRFLIAEDVLARTEEQLVQKKNEIVDMQKVRVHYNSLLRNHKVNQDMYEYLYSRMQQATAQATDDSPTVRQVDRAVPSYRAIHPRWGILVAFGALAGLGVGTLLSLALGFLNEKVRTAYDVEEILGVPLMGLVSEVRKVARQDLPRIVANGKNHSSVEEFRSIRSHLTLIESDLSCQTLLIVSTQPEEGKTFTATNLALTFAAHGERTLLVDADLRKPNVARSLGLNNSRGLLQFLTSKKTLKEVLTTEVAPNLDVLVSGGSTDRSTEKLTRSGLSALLGEARLNYDRIILDSPPISAVSDAMNLVPHVDGMIFVIRYDSVATRKAARVVQRMRETKTPIAGVVLNCASARYANYYYPGYYFHTEGYYSEKKPSEAEMLAQGSPPPQPSPQASRQPTESPKA